MKLGVWSVKGMVSIRFSKEVALIITLFLIISNLLLSEYSNAEDSSQDKGALHILTPEVSDYAYGFKEIPETKFEDGSVRFSARVKVLRFQGSPGGILLQIDFREQTQDRSQELRFSFRFATDGSILCYYPYMNSSATFTIRRGWAAGEWVSVSVSIVQDKAMFYLNNEFIGTNDPKYPANRGPFSISNIGFGQIDMKSTSVEAFISKIILITDNSTKFFEDFENSLSNYNIKKSIASIFRTVDVEKYSSIELIVKPKVISPGETIVLQARLMDESLNGIENRRIVFEYKKADVWERFGDAITLKDGYAIFSWTVARELSLGELAVRARFPGDDRFLQVISSDVTITLIHRPPKPMSTGYLVLLIYIIFLSAAFIFGFRPDGAQVIRFLIGILCSVSIYLCLPILTSSVNIVSYIGYAKRVVRIEYFGLGIDRALWMISIASLAFAFVVLERRKTLTRRLNVFPTLLVILSIIVAIQGRGEIAFFLTVILAVMSLLLQKSDETFADLKILRASFILSFIMLMLVIELGSIFGWLYNIFDPHVPFDGDVRWTVTSLEANMYGLLYPFTIPLLMIALFSWIWTKPVETIIKAYTKKYKTYRSSISMDDGGTSPGNKAIVGNEFKSNALHQRRILNSNSIAFLLILPSVFFTSILVVYYPYFYSSKLIGVDTPWYYKNLLLMMEPEGLLTVVHDYGAASRLPYLLILYVIKILTNLPTDFIVKIGPAVPSTFLGLATFHLTRSLTHNNSLAAYSAFLSLFSITTTVGIYAGVFANWLALGWGIIFLTLLHRMWQRPSFNNILSSIFASLMVLATHPWTWAVLIVTTSAFFILNMIISSLTGHRGQLIIAVKTGLPTLAVNIGLLGIILMIYRQGEFMRLSISGLSALKYENLIIFWHNITFTIQYYVGGFLANSPILILSIAGLYSLRKHSEQLGSIFNLLLIAMSLPMLFVDSWWQWRLIYMVPYQIPAIFGTLAILNNFSGLNVLSERTLKALLLSTITFVMLNYSLRCLNFIPS
ncbi:hypothetical protein KEJ51_03055 [Candidatus Bathyarchaeota archaeon]|nr:hypothetical protein [Candidatus Bathyarchaeota archaeon]MBS7629580.1 hypothetical protein [Candidatus Bathyarchaeota archaeon]